MRTADQMHKYVDQVVEHQASQIAKFMNLEADHKSTQIVGQVFKVFIEK